MTEPEIIESTPLDVGDTRSETQDIEGRKDEVAAAEAKVRASRESWEQQVERDPASVLRLIASGEYVPFSIRLELERRGLFDLNTNTYGITAAGTVLIDLDDAHASKEQ